MNLKIPRAFQRNLVCKLRKEERGECEIGLSGLVKGPAGLGTGVVLSYSVICSWVTRVFGGLRGNSMY